jgi:hypothetical protein
MLYGGGLVKKFKKKTLPPALVFCLFIPYVRLAGHSFVYSARGPRLSSPFFHPSFLLLYHLLQPQFSGEKTPFS